MKYRAHILIVDDNEYNQELLAVVLGDQYEICLASSGGEALEVLELFKPDLVLLDVVMPGMDGFEVCQSIRKNKYCRNTHIMMLTAKDKLDAKLAAYEAGADDYMTKPFERNELCAKIKVLLKLKRLEDVNMIKNDLLGFVANEINTPLNMISMPLEMLSSMEGMPAEALPLLEIISQGTCELNQLYRKAQMLISIKHDQWQFQFLEFELCELLHGVCRELKYKSDSLHIMQEVEILSNIQVKGDIETLKFALKAVLECVLDNTGANSTLRVKVTTINDLISINFMSDEVFSSFIEKSSELFTEEVSQLKGYGETLGVSIASEIAQKHHGSLSVTKEGENRFLSFLLPIGLKKEKCIQLVK